MTPSEVAAAIAAGATVIDTRPLAVCAASHLPGAVFLEFNLADLTERAELVLPKGLHAVVHAEPERTVAASVGLLEDAGLIIRGHLDGGLQAWRADGRPVHAMPCIDVTHLHAGLDRYLVLDVRERYEFVAGHIPGARLLPSGDLWSRADGDFGSGATVAVVCSGYGRAAFAASVLASRGVPAVTVTGGMYDWLRQGYPVDKGV